MEGDRLPGGEEEEIRAVIMAPSSPICLCRCRWMYFWENWRMVTCFVEYPHPELRCENCRTVVCRDCWHDYRERRLCCGCVRLAERDAVRTDAVEQQGEGSASRGS